MKKTTFTYDVTTISFFFFFAISGDAISTTATRNAVLDVSGKRLRTGVPYHVLPVTPRRFGIGGGVKPSLPRGENKATCPLDVVQSRSASAPVTFSPANPGKFVTLSADLNVEFFTGARKECSSVWRLAGDNDDEGESSSLRFVKTGGVAGAPGPATVSNWFKIASSDVGRSYKMVFCPTVCSFCKVICRDVGVFDDDVNTKRLGLSLNETLPPFLVRFKRASF